MDTDLATPALDLGADEKNSRAAEIRSLVTKAPGMEGSFRTYLSFLGHREGEPIYLQVIDPREVLRSSATAVAADVATALRLLRTAENYQAQGDYLVPNRVKKGVEARYELNRWLPDKKGEGISDKDIAVRRAMYFDADVIRDAGDGAVGGISASTREAKASIAVALSMADLLAELLGDEGALGFGMSGNGGHIHLALDDLEPDESKPTVQELLAVMGAMFTTPTVKIDTAVGDAKRIAPAFGTMKRKGSNTKERPWRRTWFVAPAVAGGRPVRRLSLAELRSLLEDLRTRLTPEQAASLVKSATPTIERVAAASPSTRVTRVFEEANRLPYTEVMARFGIAMACPGCGENKDSGFYAPANRWHCFRATCQPTSPKRLGNWSATDAVARAKGINPKDAANLICREFGIEVRGPGRPRKQLTFDDLRDRAEAVGILVDVEAENTTDPASHGVNRPKSFPLTDLGNAERLVARHGQDLHYVGQWQRWIVWDGRCWRKDDLGLVQGRAQETVRNIVHEALCAEDDEMRASIAGWASLSESKGRIDAMISMAECKVSVLPDQLNRGVRRLNCPNGTIDLCTGELLPHRREDLLTTITKVAFEPYNPFEAKTWESFLRRVQPDPEVRSFLQRLIGASVLGEVREHILPVHNGVGRNGKGTFFETLLYVLGEYATTVPEALLVESRGADHPTLLATLYGKRLAVASETKQGDALHVSRMKQITGGDTISCRRMREDWWDFIASHLLHLQTNHRLRVTDAGHAVWARLLLIEWAVTIPEEEQDPDLKTKLRGEAAQILGWIVAGAVEYLRGGLRIPESVRAATRRWRQEEDVLGQFMTDCCLTWEQHGKARLAEGKVAERKWYEASKSELYEAYRAWVTEAGLPPKGKIQFGKELQERGFTETRESGTGQHRWVGLGLTLSVKIESDRKENEGADEEIVRMMASI